MSNQIIQKIKQGEGTVIDVRSPGEFAGGHVFNSLNIPLQEIDAKLQDIAKMSKPIIVCCASGGRSGQAENYLSANGVKEVYNGGSWFDVQSWLND